MTAYPARPAPRHRAGDAVAIGLSGLCLAHCLALPLIAGFLPLLGVWAEAEWVHWLFVAMAGPVSISTLTRTHRSGLPVGLLFLAMLGVGALIAGVLGWPTEADETRITVAGSLMLSTAHLLNWRRTGRRH